jgi:hypothetical protein
VKSKPGRVDPKMAVVRCPRVDPGLVTSARRWDMDRPRRSSSTSTVTGPWATWAAKVVCSVRATWWGSPSSSPMARRARAVTTPPWGSGKRFHAGSMDPS